MGKKETGDHHLYTSFRTRNFGLGRPTAGQDQRNYTEIMEFLDSLQEKGHTIVMITHDMQLMLDYSDRALVVSDGQILAISHLQSCSLIRIFYKRLI